MKFFNTAGPVNPDKNYCLPPSIRLDEQELRSLIEQEKYFILHAPRQTGKTSTMINFARQLNCEGKYAALYVNVEPAQVARGSTEKGLEQTAIYMDTANATEGHLIIFDKGNRSWEEKIYTRQEQVDNKIITVWGL